MAEMVHFIKGEEVEVGNNEAGMKGSWYAATVLQCSRKSSRSTASKRKKTMFVEYHSLMADKGVKPLRENVILSRVRPKPPQDEADRSFQVDEKVEVFDNDGWWEGTVTEVLENQRYRVHFKESNEEIEYHKSELRTHLEWIDGKWVVTAVVQEQEIVVTPDDQGQNETPIHVQSGEAENNDHNIVLATQLDFDTAEHVVTENSPGKVQSRDIQNTDLANRGDASKNVEMKNSPSSFRISIKQTLEPIFRRERLVEVCRDDDTCYGAWFPATLLKEIDNDHFLVEFQKLRSHARGGILKATVESRYIRPFPPQTSHVKSYQLLDKVDAFYDGGWWSGLIKKILVGSRYTVSFKQNILKEFSHSELRIHMDWTNGQWSENSKEISVVRDNQCGTEPRREARSEQAVNTDQIVDLVSPLSLDATNNVAIELLPIQAQTRQDKKTFRTDMANPSCGDAVKTVASKKSHSLIISKVDNLSSSNQAGSPSCLSGEGEAVKAPMSLIACPVRGMSVGTLSKASGQLDFTTPTRAGQVTNVEGNKPRSPVLDQNVLDQLLQRYSKEHLESLNSGQGQTKHDLETNQPRNHPSVEGCSSHLSNSIDREENQLVAGSTKIQTLARQLKLEVQMPREKRKLFGGDDIEQHEMEGVSKQMTHAFYKRRHSIEKVSSPKASLKGPEHTAESRETSTFVVQAEDTLKEIEMDGASNDNRDSEQQRAMCIEESYLPSNIDEQGASSANQPTVQAMEGITWKDAPMRGLELQNPLNVMDNSYSLEDITVDNQPDKAIGDEHNECVMQSFLIEDDTPREDESLPFVKCHPHWKIVESEEILRAMPQQGHFHPLKQFNMELREGLAIGLTLSFTSIVEKIGKAEVDDPMCNLQVMLKALEELKAHGFNAKPVQARLEKLLQIKEEQGQISSQLVEVEEKINKKQHEKVMLETELEEIGMEMRKMQECLDEMKNKWISVEAKHENQGSEIAELKTTMNRLIERVQGARLEFNSVVADPW